jgi:hypothetical protein
MNDKLFERQLLLLWFLVWLQRAIRLALRATWLAGGGFLLAWAAHELWGWLPDPRTWLAVAALPALVFIAGIFFPWPNAGRLAWRIDRTFDLREQLSAAWQVMHQQSAGAIAELLVADVRALLPAVRTRVLKRGWFLAGDVVSTIVIVVLFALILRGRSTAAPPDVPPVHQAAIPALPDEPSADEILPLGIPGLEPVASSPSGQERPGSNSEQTEQPVALSDDMRAALNNLGQQLSQLAVSYEAGQALQQGDLQAAAQELEELTNQLDQLARITMEDLAKAFDEAAQQLQQMNEPGAKQLSESMQASANALGQSDKPAASQALAQTASDLRMLGSQMAGDGTGDTDQPGSGTSDDPTGSSSAVSRENGEQQPLARIFGEEGIFDLFDQNDLPGVLSPGSGTGAGNSASGSAIDRILVADDSVNPSILIPYRFYWKWRYVVSGYFSPH